jgi:hypothetical protein
MKWGMQSRHDDEEIRMNELTHVARAEKRNQLKNYPQKPRTALPRGIKAALIGLAVFFVGGSIFSVFFLRHKATELINTQATTLHAGIADLQNFDTTGAEQQFSLLGGANLPASGLFGKVLSLFQGAGGTLKSFGDLSGQLSALAQKIANVQPDVFAFVSGVQNNNLVTDLNGIKDTLAALDADSSQLSGELSLFNNAGSFDGGGYLTLRTQVKDAESFLNAFIPWLSDASSTHHVLVLLENPSEMRPGGGFIGSYADVAIKGGAVQSVSVHDIADVDAAFKPNIVPPMPLQLENARWRPADGNWFFDFPTSASETIGLFEQSDLYASATASSSVSVATSSTPTTFDAAIAISPQVVSDLLSITGPITIAHPSTTFTADNLTVQIQKIVQAGQATAATYPKDVLRSLSQAIFQRLASSTPDEQQQLLNDAAQWVSDRDAMVYFKNSDIESFVQAFGAGGEMDQLPHNFNGDYFALANADINSDKSELYMAQTVSYDATIGSDGTLADHVIIDRTHNGKQSPSWWYQTTNTDYMQLFVPDGSSLDNESGGMVRNVSAPVNYTQQGYSTDPLLLAIVSSTRQTFGYPNVASHEEDGREAFAVWSRTYAGKSTEVAFDYSHELSTPPASGVQYQFVFERQSGATGDEKIEVDAPLGYEFAENGLASFTYESTSTPGRLVFNLTLQKI